MKQSVATNALGPVVSFMPKSGVLLSLLSLLLLDQTIGDESPCEGLKDVHEENICGTTFCLRNSRRLREAEAEVLKAGDLVATRIDPTHLISSTAHQNELFSLYEDLTRYMSIIPWHVDVAIPSNGTLHLCGLGGCQPADEAAGRRVLRIDPRYSEAMVEWDLAMPIMQEMLLKVQKNKPSEVQILHNWMQSLIDEDFSRRDLAYLRPRLATAIELFPAMKDVFSESADELRHDLLDSEFETCTSLVILLLQRLGVLPRTLPRHECTFSDLVSMETWGGTHDPSTAKMCLSKRVLGAARRRLEDGHQIQHLSGREIFCPRAPYGTVEQELMLSKQDLTKCLSTWISNLNLNIGESRMATYWTPCETLLYGTVEVDNEGGAHNEHSEFCTVPSSHPHELPYCPTFEHFVSGWLECTKHPEERAPEITCFRWTRDASNCPPMSNVDYTGMITPKLPFHTPFYEPERGGTCHLTSHSTTTAPDNEGLLLVGIVLTAVTLVVLLLLTSMVNWFRTVLSEQLYSRVQQDAGSFPPRVFLQRYQRDR